MLMNFTKITLVLAGLAGSVLFGNVDDFERSQVGKTPQGWECSKRYAQKWAVELNKEKTSYILSLLKTDAYGSDFNTCYKKMNFLNGNISVKFRANSGEGDQGGGIMWRVQDADNYYVVRFNPLEDNLRVYYVKKANRSMLKGANIHLDGDKWHTLKVLQNGAHYTVYLDGKKRLQGSVRIFPRAGGVGVWTKADALSSFDDLEIIRK